ncbi:MAG: hypothetical protein M3410_02720 [Acidobacteriota bacterium]|nr:hypothetical protein [Acidobacteriota bacterium]
MTLRKFSRRRFLGAGAINVLGAFASRGAAWPAQAREFTLYVGTYTSGKSERI